MMRSGVAALFVAAVVAGSASAQVRGVTKDEILLGSHIDLSGPLAEIGRAGVNAARMAEEEANATGIHGRKLKILFEDSGYDPKKAVLATQKLIESDKIFALIMATGNAPATATYPMLIKAGVPNLMPWAGAPIFTEPFERLSFAFFPTNGDIQAPTVKYFMDQGKKRFCFIYQDDDYGVDVKEGVERALKKGALKIVEEAGYKRGATDFSAQVARVQRADCDMLVTATVPAPAAALLQEIRRRDWKVPVLLSGSSYDSNTITLGKEATEGVFAAGFIPNPDDRSPQEVKDWIAKYESKFGPLKAPLYAAYSYAIVKVAVEGLKNAGPNLTIDTLVEGMEKIKGYKTIFGGPAIGFTATNHKGMQGSALFKVEGGRWVQAVGDLPAVAQ
jgi:ABC-type branched-subunit amino acid transport system substrate-binding protein